MQEEMFRKAREEMERELSSNSFNYRQGGHSSHSSFNSYHHEQTRAFQSDRLAVIEQEINKNAINQMKAYLRTCPTDCALQREQVYIVYKFLNTPLEVLVSGMNQMQPTQLTQFYRKLAKQLHPDKNYHPQAKDAFQRVQSAMEQARASMTSCRQAS